MSNNVFVMYPRIDRCCRHFFYNSNEISMKTMLLLCYFIANLLFISATVTNYNGHCDASQHSCTDDVDSFADKKLIFYDVNPPEGFNLRRDVYMRLAIMLAEAQKRGSHLKWSLVLPPWFALYHWKKDSNRIKPAPWNKFFDLDSLRSYAPVLELYEVFSKTEGKVLKIDTLYILQNFENAFENGDFRDKWEIVGPCTYSGSFWGYQNVTAKEVLCVKFQGKVSQIWELLALHSARKVMFHHAEIPLHDHYGTKQYWDCRKSMKFNSKLDEKASEFISNTLNCHSSKCSNYLSLHWRRGDFVKYRHKDIPSPTSTAKQIHNKIKELHLQITKVSIATDGTNTAKDALKKELYSYGYEVYFYTPTLEDQNEYGEAGVAIIEQIICSHAAVFIGTHESTFSYRIQEEREILGFDSSTTFNRLCPENGPCETPSKWTIVH